MNSPPPPILFKYLCAYGRVQMLKIRQVYDTATGSLILYNWKNPHKKSIHHDLERIEWTMWFMTQQHSIS